MIPAFFGLAGTELSPDERALFAAAAPAGYILFKRNIDTPEQVRALTDSLRDLSGDPRLPILIDQEGGRVARLRPPHWPEYPSPIVFGEAWEKAPLTAMAAARANARALGLMLSGLGVSVDCLPLLDVKAEGMHEVIGDRSYGTDPHMVASLGRATLDGLKAGGCVGVVKHIPGHGRGTLDSHLALPTVTASAGELETDLIPFRRLADAPMAMTAHILYTAWDGELCASLSPTIIADIIRGSIGFDNLLMSDDLGMQALGTQPGGETMAGRAKGVIAAGCDIALHCSGDFAEMREVADALSPIGDKALERLRRAMDWASPPEGDSALFAQQRDALLGAA
ncbi:beta-hexosaminidase [Sandaracinobacter sp. RS1-74]|uniref:glycoside hydrolase family 3 N-terminal domain-containing protein n=1 Tax=Sandaracinobacteroides sayramensis TaxID=2913411 RepID=UPI001EDBDD8E|nr:glycoside hydrolase family 3 N-terminal domain-containing protein [Sandaracinobacteroides sayramensis]MCG2841694.1 beta-hexosaminidase [Sandaracinobacteroides sayramensis]